MSPKTRVLVIDDSAFMREVLREIIDKDPHLEVVDTAPDPLIAWEKIKRLRPDVLSLDVEMPRMDGLTFLEKLMQNFPIPVVMVSSLTDKGCEATLRALELGAVDFVAKPGIDVNRGIHEVASELKMKLRMAAMAQPKVRMSAPKASVSKPTIAKFATTHKVIAIGASTGGTEAVREVMTRFPPDAPGTVIVQHMPPVFTRHFAERLDRMCQVRVKEAEHGDRILPGHVLVAPGGKHVKIVRSGAQFHVEISDAAPVNRFKPSVDVLFHSCAQVLGKNAVGALLTGMGDDGARGLLAMRNAGAMTVAQDESTCVVFGMPKVAIELGGAERVVKLDAVASVVLQAAK